jgi:hypothetical protein
MPPPRGKGMIIFDDGVGIYTNSTVEQIQDEIARVTGSRVPVIRVVDAEGTELWINADHIRAFNRGNVVSLDTGVVQHDADFEEWAGKRRGRLPFRLARREPGR